MMFWLIALIILGLSMMLLVWPLVITRKAALSRHDTGLEVYRQQLEELEGDVARGVLDPAEAEPMALEIKRRLLKMSKDREPAMAIRTPGSRLALILLLVIVPAGSIGIYYHLGSPDQPSQPLAGRDIEAERKVLAESDTGNAIRQLVESLQVQPDNIDGWILLARNLSEMERYREAAETFLQATVLSPRDPGLYVGAGENYYFDAQGIVTEESAQAFETALSMDPSNPGARYYLALRDAQAGDLDGALASWVKLYRESPADAPFMELLRRRIEDTATETGTDISELKIPAQPNAGSPGPSQEDLEAAKSMSPEERQEMITGMVGRLAARMQEEPDYDGLMRLGQVYATLQNYQGSADAYARAQSLRPEDEAAMAAEAFAHIQASENQSAVPARSIEIYRALLAKDKLIPEALWYVGIAEVQNGNAEEALRLWRLLQERATPNSPLYRTVTESINRLSEEANN